MKHVHQQFNKTEESVFTLLSLSILVVQAFESLVGEEDILNAEFNAESPSFEEMANDTIREALVYQILLKATSFMEEWDGIFGVNTEPSDLQLILKVKKIAKPAHKCITSWKGLREFRNQAIAHNHRDKSGKNIYLNYNTWHSPQSDGEIYLLVYCIKSMTDIVNFYFSEVLKMFVGRRQNYDLYLAKDQRMADSEIQEKVKEVHRGISENLRKNGAFDNWEE